MAAVRMVRTLRTELGTEHGTVQRVAQQLGYGTESVRSWVRQGDVGEGHVPGVSTTEAARIKAHSNERCVSFGGPNQILKTAASFLRGGARPPAQEVVAFIDANRDDVVAGRKLGVVPICSVLSRPGRWWPVDASSPRGHAFSAGVGPAEASDAW